MTYGLTARDRANRLKRQLDVREEEEETPRRYVFGRKHIAEIERSGSNGRARTMAPSFNVPSLCTERPISADGRTPFHCNVRPISKPKSSAANGSQGKDGTGPVRKQRDPASSHDKYICRDATGDPIVAFDDYVTQIGKPHAAVYHDRVFTNIHADPVKRQAYWSAVVRCEREAQDDRYRLQFERLEPLRSNGFGKYMSNELELAFLQYLQAKDSGKAPREKSELISRAEYDHIKQQCEADGVWDSEKPPATISPGRGGRIQYRCEIEFPDGIDAAARVRIAYQICAKLKSIGVMFTAAIHQPDEHNDDKNWHFHIVFHDRPAAILVDELGNPRVDDKGNELGWDFAYAVGRSRPRYPERKNKIRLISAMTDSRRNDPEKNFASMLRHEWSALCNVELDRADVSYRFDPGSHKKLGIEYEPGVHLGNKASVLECLGTPTLEGMRNAEKRWAGKRRSDIANAVARAKARTDLVGIAERAVADLEAIASSSPAGDEAARLLADYKARCMSIDANEGPLLEFERYLGMALSRAAKTEKHCRKRIEALEAVGASAALDSELADLVLLYIRAFAHRRMVMDLIGGETTIAALRDAYIADQRAIIELGQQIMDIVCRVPEIIEQARILSSSPQPAHEPLPGSSMTVNSVFDRIVRDKLVIEERGEQEKHYRVHGLTKAEVDLLRQRKHEGRAQSRLAKIYAGRLLSAKTRGPVIAASRQPALADNEARERERAIEDTATNVALPSAVPAMNQADDDREAADRQWLANFEAFHHRLHHSGTLAIDAKRVHKWDLSAFTEQDRSFAEAHAHRPEMLKLLAKQYERAFERVVGEIIQKGPAVYNHEAGALIPEEFSTALRPFVAHLASTASMIRHATAKYCTDWSGDVLDVDDQWPLKTKSAPFRFQSAAGYPLASAILPTKNVNPGVAVSDQTTVEIAKDRGQHTHVADSPIPLDVRQAFLAAQSGRGR